MTYDPDKHHRRSIRLKGYDYAQSGAYFVTICTKDRECLFGDIVDGEMRLNDMGHMVARVWNEIPGHFPHDDVDEFIIMPNHFHGVIVIRNDIRRGEVSSPSGGGNDQIQGGETPPLRKRLGQIVAFFKYQSAKHINQSRKTPGHAVWQRNYYEHIIRCDDELNRIRQYIIDNPAQWWVDEDNTQISRQSNLQELHRWKSSNTIISRNISDGR